MVSAAGHVFDDVPRTARGHLGLLFYEAAFGVVRHVLDRARRAGARAEAALEDFPFLAPYVAELRTRLPGLGEAPADARRLRDAIGAWEDASPEWLPLRAVGTASGLSRDARATLIAVGLVEEEAGFALLFAALQAPLAHRRPTMALLREIVHRDDPAASGDAWTNCQTLVECGFADVANADAPRAEWILRVPAPVWSAIRGEPTPASSAGRRHRPATELESIEEIVLAAPQRSRTREACALAQSGMLHHLVVRGMPGVDRVGVVGAVARSMERGVQIVDSGAVASGESLRSFGALCTLSRSMPVFVLELGPSETFTVPALPGYRGPVAVVLGREGGVAGADGAARIELEPDAAPERLEHWRRALGTHAGDDLASLARSTGLSGAHIRECAPLAVAWAALDGRTAVRAADVREAARAVNRQVLDALAARLETDGRWEQLVLASSTAGELRDLERRCQYRERLAWELGHELPGGLNRGVRALFEGPSGTGKTLGARILAAELGLDLYRVDLAAVVSKYVGETEKNLSRILARAEDLDVVLLLDEGDALLTRRTDVRSSNDRYANLETNYLLQRLETYSGIVLVTTNLAGQIDPAFRRRMDVVVRFHLPDAEQRLQLWLGHLPPDHATDHAALEDIALRYPLTGGQIRNAAVHATMLALSRGGAVDRGDVLSALQVEHQKAGAAFSVAVPSSDGAADAALADFLGAIS